MKVKQCTLLCLVAVFLLAACVSSPKTVKQGEEIDSTIVVVPQKKINVYDVEALVNDSCNNPQLWLGHLEND